MKLEFSACCYAVLDDQLQLRSLSWKSLHEGGPESFSGQATIMEQGNQIRELAGTPCVSCQLFSFEDCMYLLTFVSRMQIVVFSLHN